MASDWIFYFMTQPLGLAVVAGAVAMPFLLWRLVLGPAYRNIGSLPLVVAYALAGVGLLAYSFASSHVRFTQMVASNVLAEGTRGATVFGWTIYLAVLSLVFVLPLLGVVAVPLSAFLIRVRRFTVGTTSAVNRP